MGDFIGPIDSDEIDGDVLEDVDVVDVSASGDSLMPWAFDGEFTGSMDMSDLQFGDALQEHTRQEMERVETAIRGAIMAGYDGIDINRPGLSAGMDAFGVVSIEPWHRPAPDGANGHRTERYTWDWFSDDELTEILRADSLSDVFDTDE